MKKRFLSAMALVLGANVTWADSGTTTAPVVPAVPTTPAKTVPAASAPGTTTAVAAPRTLQLPEAQAVPKGGQAPMAQPPDATTRPTPAAPGATAQPPAQATTAAPAQNGRNGVAAPKVDLRDCHIGPEGCYWVGAEYLLWWMKDGPVPVSLVTTATGPGSIGALGQPNTAVVFGNNGLNYGTLSGARVETGMWLNERHTLGIDAGFFFLQQGTTSDSFASNAAGSPLLARPVFDVVTNTQTALLVSAPGALTGGVTVTSASQFWGFESNFIRNLWYTQCFRADLTFGFRNLNLEEDLQVAQTTGLVPGGNGSLVFPGAPTGTISQLAIADRFGATNHFYGGQIGGRFQWYRGCWILDVTTKVALGVNHEAVNILGQTSGTSSVTGATSSVTSGLLAINNSNYGPRINDTTNYFSVVPEVKLGVGYRLSRYLQARVAWDFLYLSGVARPGNHIDTNVNQTLIPASSTFAPLAPPLVSPASGPFAPNLSIRQTDFWAQGVNFSLLFTY